MLDFHSLWVLCQENVWAKLYSLEYKIFSKLEKIFFEWNIHLQISQKFGPHSHNPLNIRWWVIILLASVIINSLTHACIQLGCSHMCTHIVCSTCFVSHVNTLILLRIINPGVWCWNACLIVCDHECQDPVTFFCIISCYNLNLLQSYLQKSQFNLQCKAVTDQVTLQMQYNIVFNLLQKLVVFQWNQWYCWVG